LHPSGRENFQRLKSSRGEGMSEGRETLREQTLRQHQKRWLHRSHGLAWGRRGRGITIRGSGGTSQGRKRAHKSSRKSQSDESIRPGRWGGKREGEGTRRGRSFKSSSTLRGSRGKSDELEGSRMKTLPRFKTECLDLKKNAP